MRLVLAAILGALASFSAAGGEPPDRRLAVSTQFVDPPSEIRIGDVLTFEISVSGTASATPPSAASFRSDAWEPLGEAVRTSSVDADGASRSTIRYRLEALDTGALEIPAIAIATDAGAISTVPTSIFVTPLTTADSEPAEAKLALPSPRGGSVLPTFLAGLAATALVYRALAAVAGRSVPGEIALVASAVAWLRHSNRRGPAAPLVHAASPSARQAALRAVKELVHASRTGYDVAAMHARLADVAGSFARAACDVDARERTTGELVKVVRARGNESDAHEIAAVLEACDLVKFARDEPSADAFRASAERFGRAVRHWSDS